MICTSTPVLFLTQVAHRDLRSFPTRRSSDLAYCLAGDIISAKTNVPVMYRFELMGTPTDVTKVREGLDAFWQQHSLKKKDRKSTRLNSSHVAISYAVFCLKNK